MPDDAEDAFDPIALTLAVWLGLLVGIAGLIRLSDNAAAQAAIARANARTDTTRTASPVPASGLPLGT